ncbi:Integral membrane protein 2B [Trichuris trichiura]|uniref:Integral membrane protein 2 n=1 Tax=Trichuris trichiura TaxID=36087 RepID=A0A077Z1L4_TRITR|nr:Integral membrane protein 2B [Trichuris trichiura]
MTIPTKLNSSTKEGKGKGNNCSAQQDAENSEVKEGLYKKAGEYEAGGVHEEGSRLPIHLERYIAWQRHRVLTILCMTAMIVWLLMASIVGTLVLYRYMTRRPVFVGSCVTEVVDNTGENPVALAQNVEVDTGNHVEKIQVPAFGPNRPATFVHDFMQVCKTSAFRMFSQNITLIKDLLGNKCFLKPLDREIVAPPSNLIDLMEKLASGYYQPKPSIVRENFSVHLPALKSQEIVDLKSVEVAVECTNVPTYWLVPVKEERRFRRAVATSGCSKEKFSFFNGDDSVVMETVTMCA